MKAVLAAQVGGTVRSQTGLVAKMGFVEVVCVEGNILMSIGSTYGL